MVDYADRSTLIAVCHPRALVTVAESLYRNLGKVSEWCDVWRMKLNMSKNKTMKVSRQCTMHPPALTLTIGGTMLNESNDLVILVAHLIIR